MHAPEERAAGHGVHDVVRPMADSLSGVGLRAALAQYGHDDPAAGMLLKGAPMAGSLPGRPAWPPRTKESNGTWSRAELLAFGTSTQSSTWNAIRPSSNDTALWKASIADVSKKKKLGPFYSLKELIAILGPDFVIQMSFPVEQDDKTRVCDNYDRSGGNNATFVERKLTLSTLDEFFALASAMRAAFPGEPLFFFKRDHEGAYRQIPILESDLPFAVVAFWDPTQQRRVAFIHLVMPFGATASVNNYNRVSQAITGLARRALCLPVDSYFDDFWGILPARFALAAFDALGELNSIFGLSFKASKDMLPASEGDLLGHTVCIRELPFTAANTERRKAKIRGLFGTALASGKMSSAEGGKAAGLAGFACTALYGRVGRAALKPLYALQHEAFVGTHPLRSRVRQALCWFLDFLETAPPRVSFVSQAHLRPVKCCFTDAAGSGMLAVVVFGASGTRPRFTSLRVPYRIDFRLQQRGTQIIAYEALATLLGFATFPEFFTAADVHMFIDSTAAGGALLKGFCAASDILAISAAFWGFVAKVQCGVWLSRVDSHANIADGPTRPDDLANSGSQALRSLGARFKAPQQAAFVQMVEAALAQVGL